MPDAVADLIDTYLFLRAFPGYTAASMAAEDAEVIEGLRTIHGAVLEGADAEARLRRVSGR